MEVDPAERVRRGIPSYAEEDDVRKPHDGWFEQSFDENGSLVITHRIPTKLPSDIPPSLWKGIAQDVHSQYLLRVRRAETNSRVAYLRRLHHHDGPVNELPYCYMEDIDNLEDDDSDDQEKYRTYRVMPKKEGEAEAEVYESEERDPRKIETRELIRMDTRLGLDAKTVLLLVTQIPEGCWTDYDTIRRHIYKHWKTRRGLHKLAQKFDRIPRALANNRLGNDRVPCHRVVGYRQLYPMICVAGHVHDQDLLRAEGVRFGADDVPLGEPWDGFTGCPRVSLDCTTTG